VTLRLWPLTCMVVVTSGSPQAYGKASYAILLDPNLEKPTVVSQHCHSDWPCACSKESTYCRAGGELSSGSSGIATNTQHIETLFLKTK
jgi:hypothetical protein